MITRSGQSSSKKPSIIKCPSITTLCIECTRDCITIPLEIGDYLVEGEDYIVIGDTSGEYEITSLTCTPVRPDIMPYDLRKHYKIFPKYHVFYVEEQIPKKIKYRSIDRKPFYNLKQPVSRQGFKRGQRRNNAKRRA